MYAAIREFAVRQSLKAKHRVTISDVVVQALRNAGFEREEVLEALANGEVPEIDVRRRTAASQRPIGDRLADYMVERGCQTEVALQRNLHMKAAEIRRGVEKLIERKLARERPFDRPVIVHWIQTCKCAIAVDPEIEKEEG